MKKIALLAIALLILPGIAAAQCSKDGDPGFYGEPFLTDTQDVFAGATYDFYLAPINWGGYAGAPAECQNADTFCIHAWDTGGWAITGANADDPPNTLDDCWILDPGYYDGSWVLSITVPCEVAICDYDTLYVGFYYCDINGVCDPTCEDCHLSNYGGTDYPNEDMIILHVVESPPALYIMQDSLFTIEQGQTAAYVPFGICNGDPCAPPTDYNYNIVSKGHIGAAINTSGGLTGIPGGECDDAYGIIDAGAAAICDLDTLTIIAWDATGAVYDTCVQIIHVVEPIPVPLFSTPVITILVLAMILSAAVFMRRRAANRA
jgi:hypothetical protein